MKQYHYLTFICLQFVFSFAGISQITITSSSMPGNGDTARVSVGTILTLGNYEDSGPNYAWHFEDLKPISQEVRNFKSALLTPYAFYFASASKYGEKTQDSIGVSTLQFKNIYSFYKKTNSEFSAEGIGFSFSGIPLAGTYSDDDELYQFPLDYLDHDSSTFKFKVSLPTIGAYGKEGYRISDVDGWGMIYTPFDSAQCLRVVSTQYSVDSITTASYGNFGFPNVTRSYAWLTTSQKVPFLEVNGNVIGSTFIPTQIRYRDSVRFINLNPFGIGVNEVEGATLISGYPNPATDSYNLMLYPAEGNYMAELYDMTGKMVLKENLGICNEPVNKRSLNLHGLAPGMYTLRVSNGSTLQTIKLNKQ